MQIIAIFQVFGYYFTDYSNTSTCCIRLVLLLSYVQQVKGKF